MSAYEPKSGAPGGRGFYLALALCLAGAGIAALFAADPAASDVPSAAQSASSPPAVQEVERPVENVRRSASTAPAPRPSSSEAPPLPALQSESAAAETPAPVSAPRSVTFLLPVDGEVLAPFSDGELVKSTTLGDWRTHNGVDIRCEEGDPILAPAAGRVSAVESDPLWGTVVVIDHANGVVSRCCGLAGGVSVQEGETVSAGQPIGAAATAPAESLLPVHLHFEVLENGAYVDPLSRLG